MAAIADIVKGLPSQFNKPLQANKCTRDKFKDLFLQYFDAIHKQFHIMHAQARVEQVDYSIPPAFEIQTPNELEKMMIAQGKRGFVAVQSPIADPYQNLESRIVLKREISASDGLLQLCSQEHFNPLSSSHAVMLAVYVTLARIWGKKRFDAYFSGERRLVLDPYISRTPLMHIYERLLSFLRPTNLLEKGNIKTIKSSVKPACCEQVIYLGNGKYRLFLNKRKPVTEKELREIIIRRRDGLEPSQSVNIKAQDYREILFEKKVGLSFQDIMKVRQVASDEIQKAFPMDPISKLPENVHRQFRGYDEITAGEYLDEQERARDAHFSGQKLPD